VTGEELRWLWTAAPGVSYECQRRAALSALLPVLPLSLQRQWGFDVKSVAGRQY